MPRLNQKKVKTSNNSVFIANFGAQKESFYKLFKFNRKS